MQNRTNKCCKRNTYKALVKKATLTMSVVYKREGARKAKEMLKISRSSEAGKYWRVFA